jgi:hypothetical protein
MMIPEPSVDQRERRVDEPAVPPPVRLNYAYVRNPLKPVEDDWNGHFPIVPLGGR